MPRASVIIVARNEEANLKKALAALARQSRSVRLPLNRATELARVLRVSEKLKQELGRDPFAETLYVFTNRRRTAVKCLTWERNGFCLWHKQLEAERFQWPLHRAEALLSLTGQPIRLTIPGCSVLVGEFASNVGEAYEPVTPQSPLSAAARWTLNRWEN